MDVKKLHLRGDKARHFFFVGVPIFLGLMAGPLCSCRDPWWLNTVFFFIALGAFILSYRLFDERKWDVELTDDILEGPFPRFLRRTGRVAIGVDTLDWNTPPSHEPLGLFSKSLKLTANDGKQIVLYPYCYNRAQLVDFLECLEATVKAT